MPGWAVALMFGLWLCVGLGVWRVSGRIKSAIGLRARAWRIGLSSVLLAASVLVLLGTFLGVESKQLGPAPLAWPLIAITFAFAGSIFVAAQCIACASLVTILEENVTGSGDSSSIQSKGRDHQ
jgi:hypothetical protein